MKHLLLIACAIFALQSCKDIIAENITGKTPVIIIPNNGQVVNTNPVHFKWEPMEGATKYRLQVVSPSFANISDYALDSMVTGTDFYFPLDSNEYELKLTAMNAGYTSNTLDSVFFKVGVSPSQGNGTTITLLTPADSAFFSSQDDFDSQFTWTDLSEASYYEFYLKKGTSFAAGVLYDYDEHVNPPYKTTNIELTEGQYHWGVRAYLNDGTESEMTKRKFFIDSTRPMLPNPVSPASSVSPGDVVFTWNSGGNDPGMIHAPVSSIIQVADDQNFTMNVETETFTGTTGTINLIGSGVRYWRIKNVDAAGNESFYSDFIQFTLF